MRRTGRAVLAGAGACIGLALGSAAAAEGVTVIRGTEVSVVGVRAEPGKPVIIRGIAPGTSWTPETVRPAPPPAPVVRAGEGLWLVEPDGTVLACSLRGSGRVDRVSREVIVCTRAWID